jgi:putative membrane protein
VIFTLFGGAICAADLSSDDKSFLEHAAEGNNAEIALANLALKKTAREDIKAFANRIVTDHQKANEQLKGIAAANHVEMPAGMGLKYTAEKARLTMLGGRDFEDDYVNTMVDDHQADIEAFEKEVQYGADADLKKFASMTIPILKQHLSMAKTLQGKTVMTK